MSGENLHCLSMSLPTSRDPWFQPRYKIISKLVLDLKWCLNPKLCWRICNSTNMWWYFAYLQWNNVVLLVAGLPPAAKQSSPVSARDPRAWFDAPLPSAALPRQRHTWPGQDDDLHSNSHLPQCRVSNLPTKSSQMLFEMFLGNGNCF